MADRRADRAASETLGFIFVFAIVIGTIGAVYTVGFDGLTEARDFERSNNAERAFDVLADNQRDIAQGGAPSRATEVKLAEAELREGPAVAINVTVERSGTQVNSYEDDTVAPLVFEAESGSEVVYINDAVVRNATDAGSAMAHEPRMFVFGEDRTVVPVVDTTFSTGGAAGSSTVLVRTKASDRGVTLDNRTGGPYDVTLNVTSPYPAAWNSYFESEMDWESDPCTTTGTTVSCEFSTDSVYVTYTKLRVAIQ